jgi:hypothetical protein
VLARPATISGMVDLLQSITDRLAALGWSRADLVERANAKHGTARSTAYKFLSGSLKGTNIKLVNELLDTLDLDILLRK